MLDFISHERERDASPEAGGQSREESSRETAELSSRRGLTTSVKEMKGEREIRSVGEEEIKKRGTGESSGRPDGIPTRAKSLGNIITQR